MHAFARLRLLPDRVATLTPGELVGRTWSAALHIDHPMISEAHAMLSLRGDELVLLSLRRRLWVEGRAEDVVRLAPGLKIRLAPDVELLVEEIGLPDHVLGLAGPGLAPTVLAGTCSLVFDPHPRLASGTQASAAATFWPTDGRWRVRLADQVTRELGPGARLELPQGTFTAVPLALASAGQQATRVDPTGPLRIVANYDTVHVHRGPGAPLVLTGQLARLVSELVSVHAPLAWTELASALWPQIEDRDLLRRRWDVLLVRLRERLREGGVRPDLVQSTGVGLVELVLQEGDQLEDRT